MVRGTAQRGAKPDPATMLCVTPQQMRRQQDAQLIRSGRRFTYTAHYEREADGRWFIQIPELYLAAKARRVEEIEGMVRRLVVQTLDVDADAFDVRLEPAD